MGKVAVYLLLLLSFLCSAQCKPISSYPYAPESKGVGFAITGAGGRIGQLAALCEALMNGAYPNGTAVRPSYLAGVSSGAIIAVGLSAALETLEQNVPNGFSFSDLHDLIFNMKNKNVFKFKIFDSVQNLDDGYILDNSPFKKFLSGKLKEIGYQTLGDLYLPTTITTVDQRLGINVRLSSVHPSHASLPLVDVLVASASIPIAFSPARIPALSEHSRFIDGATGVDFVPVVPLLAIPEIRTIYVITYNFALTAGIKSNDDFDADHGTLARFALRAFDIQSSNVAIGALEVLKSYTDVTGYIYEPNTSKIYSATDFESGRRQYDEAKQWASVSDPVPVGLYKLTSSLLPNYTWEDEQYEGISGGAVVTWRAFASAITFVIVLFLL